MVDTRAPLDRSLIYIGRTLTRSVWLQLFDHPMFDDPEMVVIPDVGKARNDAELEVHRNKRENVVFYFKDSAF